MDMSAPGGRGALSRQVVRACAEHGFFRAVSHGVPPGPAARLDAATAAFFALAPHDKQRAGPPSPLGYGCRSIGFNGDAGELEYLLLHASPAAVAHRARSIDTDDPSRFRYTIPRPRLLPYAMHAHTRGIHICKKYGEILSKVLAANILVKYSLINEKPHLEINYQRAHRVFATRDLFILKLKLLKNKKAYTKEQIGGVRC